jgi:hypothetical protein
MITIGHLHFYQLIIHTITLIGDYDHYCTVIEAVTKSRNGADSSNIQEWQVYS